MTGRMSTDLRRASAMLLVGIFVTAGCASAAGQATRTSTAAHAAATSKTPGSPATGSQPAQSAGGGPSGIAGRAVGIVCGGPSSEQGCPRRPERATIDVLRMPSGRRIATVRTDHGGHFRLDLPPGAYELRARTSSFLVWARVVTIRVLPHRIKHTIVTFVPRHPLPVAPGSASG